MKEKINVKKFLMKGGVFLFLSFTPVLPVWAAEIVSIDVEALLHHDGSATITERWTTAAVDEGTQMARRVDLPPQMTFHSLEVQDMNGHAFVITDDWNVRTTFAERANHASLLTTNSGYEIVWGITAYGNHHYVVTYTLDNFVQGFLDGTGFFYQFVPAGLSPAPQHVSLKLMAADVALTDDNTIVSLLDGMDGTVAFSDGVITVEGVHPLTADDALVLKALFEDGLFEPLILNDAWLAGETVDEIDDDLVILLLVLSAGFIFITVVMVVVFLVLFSKTKLSDGTVKKWPSIKEIPVQYDVPFGLSLPAIYYLIGQSSPFHLSGSAFGAYLLKWHQAGLIEITKSKKRHIITLYPLKTDLLQIEQVLYDLLESRVDGQRQLSSAERKIWEKLMKKINEWQDTLQKTGEKELGQKGMIALDGKKKWRFTPVGYQVLLAFWGFMKYLKEEHKQNDLSQPFDQSHLIIATMAGLNKEMKKYFDNHVSASDEVVFWQTMWMTQAFNTDVQATYQNSAASGGFDASVPTGGGGGGIS